MENILLACTVGDIAWLKRCLSAVPDPATSRNKEGLNSLHLAAKNGHLECLRHLLNNCSINVDETVPSSGQTALHFSISTKNGVRSLQCMKLLLERGASQNKQNSSGQTALHVAAKKGHTKCLKRLLEQGADFDIMDKDEHTACDLATLHGHYECARLLQALHWAKRKDATLKTELQTKSARQRQERERRVLHTRLRREAAEAAYSDWACKKSKPAVQPPGACKERQELRSQPQTPHTCSSCLKAGTRKQSAKEAEPRVTSPVTVTLHQTKRNTESTGKPDKMHPYTNHPSRKQGAKTPRKPAGKSGRQSRATKSSTRSTTPTPTSADCQTENSSVRGQCPQPEGRSLTADKPVDDTHIDSQSQHAGGRDSCASDCASGCNESSPPCELNLGFLKANALQSEVFHSREFEDQVKVHFVVGGMREEDSEEEEREEEEEEREEREEGEEEDEDIAFHDVGKANSLDALALPSVLTKDQTPAEVIQLLRCLGSTKSSRNYGRSRSYSSHYNRRPSLTNRLQRRFSLGAIPEGQMVTNYSNESVSSLDDQSVRLRYGDAAWEEEEDEQTPQNGTDHGEWFILEREEGEEREEGGGQEEEGEEEEEEEEREVDVHRQEEGKREEEEDEEEEAKKSHSSGTVSDDPTPHNNTNHKPMLSIVNLAWDSASNRVHTRVTKSSMVPANHPLQGRQRHSRPVSISPRPRSMPQLRSHSPSPRTAPCVTLPNSLPPNIGASARPLTPKSTPPKLGVPRNSTWGCRSPPPGPFSPAREPAEAQEVGRRNGSTSPGLKLPSLSTSSTNETKTPEPVATSVISNASPQNMLFPAHSLFSGMNGLASKSMIHLGTPSTLLPSGPPDSTNTEPYAQPKLRRRIKSAPNMLNLSSDSRPLKTSTFTYGGKLE